MGSTWRDPFAATAVALLGAFGCAAPDADSSVAATFGEASATIGVLEGDPSLTLGGVDDLTVGPNADVFVLDAKNFLVRRYSPLGEPHGQIGREGDGPDEFRWPASIAFDGEGHLVVLSLAHQNLARFGIDPDAMWFLDAPRLPFPARDICFLGSRTYILAVHEGHLVHEVSKEGELIRSFGEPLPYPVSFPVAPDDPLSEILRDYSAMGHLLCHEPTGSVLVIPYNLPNLRAWSADGALRWETVLHDYSQTQIVRRGNRFSMGVDPETGVATATISLFGIDAQWVGLQTVEGSASLAPSEAPIQSFVVDIEDGSMRWVHGNLPRIKEYRAGVAYAWEESPFPRVRIASLDFGWN